MQRIVLSTVLSTCALVAFAARAQPASEDSIELSLAEAQDRAALSAPEVTVALRQVGEAAATRVGAGIVMPVNPTLSFDARPGLDDASRGAFGVSSTLDFLFEVGGAPSARVREAHARTRAARAEVEVVQAEARLRALQAYVGERIAELRIEHARQAVELGNRVLVAARERSQAGAGSEMDVASARAELAEFQAEQYAAEAERHQSLLALRILLAIPPGATLRLTSTIDAPAPAAPIDELIRRARARLPDLGAIRARLALLRASQQRLSAEAFPKLGAYVGVDASPRSPVFGIAGVSIELPLARRNQTPRAVVAAERLTEQTRYEQTFARLEVALRAIRQAYEAQRSELEVLTDVGLPAAQTHLDLMETGFRAGRFDVFRLTSAAQSLVRLKAVRVAALSHIWQQRSLLDRLTGGTNDGPS
jgi:outer membrane protein TolC